MELTCPKCHGTMRTYERNGVHVDQCTECRGIFLDRGELERLIDAENDWHERDSGGRPAASSQHAPAQEQHVSGHTATGSSGGLGSVVNEVLSQVGKSKSSSHGSYGGHGYQKKRKESFLSDLFG
jgi:Zn-finger nucleic acid-binding protein